jgi:hypothetical protein
MGVRADKVKRSPPARSDESPAPERSPAPEPSEDFAERQDIETADEPEEQHNRRHHARDAADVESVRPA